MSLKHFLTPHLTMTTTIALPNLEEGAPAASPGCALKPLWQMFDEAAARYPERTAVSFGEQQLSYGELQMQASALARRLRGLGVGPESLVGVYLERTPRAIVALLAILKAGGAYLPLDPAYPEERVRTILEDARPVVLLTERGLLSRLPVHSAHLLCLDSSDERETASSAAADAPIEAVSGLENLAYVIYTSGSTGKPKGVMVTHANVARLLTETTPWFHFNQEDVWTVFHSLAFDFSVWEVWGCLLHGGRLVVVPFEVSRSPEDFYELLIRERVTVLNQTPSAFYQLATVDQVRRSSDLALRVVIFGGEALNFSVLRPWFAAHGDQRPRLINMYGITETTVHVTYREVTAADAATGAHSLIGVPIPDLTMHLLDGERKPTQAGEVGEIYVGGVGVARGYLNRPELDAERFLSDPLTTVRGGRMYKTGDLARFLPDGEMEYLGRADDQVKINGFRIELGEVEAAIVGHRSVREARVVAHTDAAGTKRLVAYYVAHGGVAVTASEVSRFLGESLPPWMMPSVYLPISSFPLTPHGKVDFAALPRPTLGSRGEGAGAAGTDLEKEVAGVWREVLGAERVGLDDNFFDIGGTSLLLVSVHGRLQKLLGAKISVADLFAYTTVRTLAKSLGGGASESEAQAKGQGNLQNRFENQAQKQRAAFARARAFKKATL
jgi:amino acid adenylation domain-containing protein